MSEPSWLWAVFTLIAAAAQTVRNAAQRELTGKLGTVGATHVRFLFGCPFALIFLLAVLLTGAVPPRPGLVFWPWMLAGALMQIAATALMLAAMGERSFVVAIAYIKTEPVQVALFGLIFLGDTVTARMAAAILIATAGVIVVSAGGRRAPDQGGRPSDKRGREAGGNSILPAIQGSALSSLPLAGEVRREASGRGLDPRRKPGPSPTLRRERGREFAELSGSNGAIFNGRSLAAAIRSLLSGGKPAVIGLAAGACFALSAIGYRGAILKLEDSNYLMAATFTMAIGLVVQSGLLSRYLAWRDPGVLAAIAQSWKPSLFAGFMGALATQFWFLAFALATAASVRTLALVEVLFAQAISRFVFHEPVSRREGVGISLILAGVLLLVWT